MLESLKTSLLRSLRGLRGEESIKLPTNYSLAAGATSICGNPESACSLALIATAAIHQATNELAYVLDCKKNLLSPSKIKQRCEQKVLPKG
jgi:hypothetical protein